MRMKTCFISSFIKIISQKHRNKGSVTLRRKTLCRKDSLPKRHLAEKNRRMPHFAEKLLMANLPNTVKNLIL